MKIKIDKRPSTDNDKPFFALRLYPESNEEMGKMEWGIEVMKQPISIERVFNGTGEETFHYVIVFGEDK